VPAGLIAIPPWDPVIDAVALRLPSGTADRRREYLRVDDEASASGTASGVLIIAH